MKTTYTTDKGYITDKGLNHNRALFVDFKHRSLDLKKKIYEMKARINAMKAQKKIAYC